VIRCGSVPGREVSEALRALASRGELPLGLSGPQLVDAMVGHGGDERARLRYWAYELPKMELIK